MRKIIDFILDSQMFIIALAISFFFIWPLIMCEGVETKRIWIGVIPILYNIAYCFFFYGFIDSKEVKTWKVLKQPLYMQLILISFLLVILVFTLAVFLTSIWMFLALAICMILSILALLYANSKYQRL